MARLNYENIRRHQQLLHDFMNRETQEAVLQYTEGSKVLMSGVEWEVTEVRSSGVLFIRRQDTGGRRTRVVNSRDVKPA